MTAVPASARRRFGLLSWVLVLCLSCTGIGPASAADEHGPIFRENGELTELGKKRFSDWSFRWKAYPTKIPGWNASISYAGVPDDEIDHPVAPCGDQGVVAYLSDFRSPDELKVAQLNLRTGEMREYALPKLDLSKPHAIAANATGGVYRSPEYDFDNKDYNGISCSPDGSRIVLTFFNTLEHTQKLILVDLKTLTTVSLGESYIAKRYGIEWFGRPVNPSFTMALGDWSEPGKQQGSGMKVLPLEDMVAAVKNHHGGNAVVDVVLGEDSAAFLAVTWDQPKGKGARMTYIQMAGEHFSKIRKCSIRNFTLREWQRQRASAGLILTLSPPNDMRARPYLVTLGNHPDGSCDMRPLGGWVSTTKHEVPGYAGDPSLFATANYKVPAEYGAGEFNVDFLLTENGRTVPLFSSEIEFKFTSEFGGPLWTSVSPPSKNQFTFMYGPWGAGTVFIHFWRSNQ